MKPNPFKPANSQRLQPHSCFKRPTDSMAQIGRKTALEWGELVPSALFDRHESLASNGQEGDQVPFGDEKTPILVRLELPDLRTGRKLFTDIALGILELPSVGMAGVSPARWVLANPLNCLPQERRLLLAQSLTELIERFSALWDQLRQRATAIPPPPESRRWPRPRPRLRRGKKTPAFPGRSRPQA